MRRALLTSFLLVLAPTQAVGQADGPPMVMSLTEAAQIALQRSLSIRTSLLNARAAEAAVGAANGAFDPMLVMGPSISSSSTGVLSSGSLVSGTSGLGGVTATFLGTLPVSTQYAMTVGSSRRYQNPLSSQTFESEYDNTLTFSLTQPLLRGFGGAAGMNLRRAAEAGSDAARDRHLRETEIILAQVQIFYYQLAQREAEEAQAARSLAHADTILQQNIELHELERISRIDLIASQSGVATRRNALTLAVGLRENAADQLVALIYGEEAGAMMEDLAPRLRTVMDSLDIPDLPSMRTAAETAVAQRPDVDAARRDIERQAELLGLDKNSMKPDLALTASYTTLANNTAGAFDFTTGRNLDFESSGWSAGLSFTLPVGNRRAKGLFDQAIAISEQSNLLLAAVENGARVEARAAHRGISRGLESFDQAEEAYRLASDLYDGEFERRRLGLSDSFRLLQVEDQVSAASTSLIRARFALYTAITEYKLALGRVILAEYEASLGNE